MIIVWIKILVGAILMLIFFVPLLAIARDYRLREEPMPLLVFNLALTDFVFGGLAFSIGVLDAVFSEDIPLPLCVSLQYWVAYSQSKQRRSAWLWISSSP